MAAAAAGLALMALSGSAVAAVLTGAALSAPLWLRVAGPARVVLRYLERLVSHGATFRALADLRVWFFRGFAARAAGGLGFRQAGDLLSRLVADIETLDGLYLRILLLAGGGIVCGADRRGACGPAIAGGGCFGWAAVRLRRVRAAVAGGTGRHARRGGARRCRRRAADRGARYADRAARSACLWRRSAHAGADRRARGSADRPPARGGEAGGTGERRGPAVRAGGIAVCAGFRGRFAGAARHGGFRGHRGLRGDCAAAARRRDRGQRRRGGAPRARCGGGRGDAARSAEAAPGAGGLCAAIRGRAFRLGARRAGGFSTG
ncbi:MAG: hypothetical protein WDN04_20995 [Rhodospirillales bacterium]